MSALETRISALERQGEPDPDDPGGLNALSDDRVRLLHLDICRAIRADPSIPTEAREKADNTIGEIEHRIRRCAASWSNPEYAEHWAWVREYFNDCHPDAGPLVPPITAEIDWWPYEAGRVAAEMCWRREVRARPDVATLIAEGEAVAAKRTGEIQ